MQRRRITRRQVLVGAGGFSLGLPFLPSLVPGPAFAQDPEFVQPPRFFMLTSDHGGVFESAMFPDESLLTETLDLYSGHQISQGTLVRSVNGDRAEVAPMLSGPADVLTEALVGKMNVLRGLDIPFYIAHHTGGHLGNFARNDGNGEQGQGLGPMPTIDQLMAWSDNFYTDLTGIKLRSIITGSRGRMSYMWSNPSDRTGEISEVRREDNASALFQEVFVPEESSDPSEPPRSPIVDRVFENYQTLRQSNRRLSAADRQRLDDHMDRLAELQRRLNAAPVQRETCGDLENPGNPSGTVARMQALADVIVAAFLCGTSRIAVLGLEQAPFASDGSDWHQGVAHQWEQAGPQAKLQEATQGIFEKVFLYLASRLDVEEAPGQTVLDNSYLTWTQESGESTHNSRSIPVITFGSGAGFYKTGIYADYRNKTKDGIVSYWSDPLGYSGLLYNQFLATTLTSMGLPRDEWQNIENNASSGYGYPQFAPEYKEAQVPEVIENASEPLPFIVA